MLYNLCISIKKFKTEVIILSYLYCMELWIYKAMKIRNVWLKKNKSILELLNHQLQTQITRRLSLLTQDITKTNIQLVRN
jgi:hypothetical protein